MRQVDLVLGGSGTRLFAYPGALRELHEAGFVFRSVRGTSGGAIVGALLASRYDPHASSQARRAALDWLIEEALSFDLKRLCRRRFFIELLWGKPKGRLRTDAIERELRRRLPATFAELRTPLAVAAFQVNLEEKRTVMLDRGDLPSAVVASMAIPLAFDPVLRNGALLVDGGLGANLPVPKNGHDVLALCFGRPGSDQRIPIDSTIDLAAALIDGVVDEGVRRALEAAPHAEVIPIYSTLPGLSFQISRREREQAIQEGAESVRAWLADRNPTRGRDR